MINKYLRRIIVIYIVFLLLATIIINFMIYDIKANDDSLIAYWSFDEGSGNIVADSAGNNNGTLTNMNTTLCWIVGVSGKAIRFDGIDDYIDCEDVLSLSISDVLSVEAWVNFTEIGSQPWQGVITKNDYLDWAFAVGGTQAPGKAVIYISGTVGGGSGNVISTSTINDGIWHHILATYDGITTRLYVDGIEESNSTLLIGAIHTSTRNLIIGNYETLLQPFNGSIDEVRIYNRVLTTSEIKDLYEQNVKYIAYWSFDNKNDPGYDNSGNGIHGTVYGATWTSGLMGDGALIFDGIEDYVDIPDWNVSTTKDWTVTALVQTEDNDYDDHGWRVGAPILGNHYNTVQGEFGLDNGKIAYNYYNGSGNEITGDSKVADGRPHFLVWRNHATNEIDMFVDGLPVATGIKSGPVKYEERFQIRTIGKGYNDYFDGIIDEIHIYNRALSDNEIENLYYGYNVKKSYYVAYIDRYEERINDDFLNGNIYIAEIGNPGNWISQIQPIDMTPSYFKNKCGNVDVSSDGKKIVFAYNNSGNWDIVIGDLNYEEYTIENYYNITMLEVREEYPKFSWDGTKIVYKNDTNISIYDLITKQFTQITSNDYEDRAPFFSPDGRSIVFTRRYEADNDSSDEICYYDNNTDKVTRLTNNSIADWYPVFLTNNEIMFILKDLFSNDDLYSYNLISGQKELKYGSFYSEKYLYPLKNDTDYIAFTRQDNNYNLYVYNVEIGLQDPVRLSDGIPVLGPSIFLPSDGFSSIPQDKSSEGTSTPGFVLILLIVAISIIIFLKIKKRNR